VDLKYQINYQGLKISTTGVAQTYGRCPTVRAEARGFSIRVVALDGHKTKGSKFAALSGQKQPTALEQTRHHAISLCEVTSCQKGHQGPCRERKRVKNCSRRPSRGQTGQAGAWHLPASLRLAESFARVAGESNFVNKLVHAYTW